mmetsp:Transcript_17731/g.57345  ORF Transcript_17731/g.57345 Transcript_17731/m.57345 type:complete len:250 (+) Transcript_17731:1176-1925(+)
MYLLAAERAHALREKLQKCESGLTGVSQREAAAVEADALAGVGQLAAMNKQWEEAEGHLEAALAAAELWGGEEHPHVAMVLMCLGHVYTRTGRFSLAEGLFRRAGNLVGCPIVETAGQAGSCMGRGMPSPAGLWGEAPRVHVSTLATLKWRHAQLLSLIANRVDEGQRWKDRAVRTWAGEGADAAAIEEASEFLTSALGPVGGSVFGDKKGQRVNIDDKGGGGGGQGDAPAVQGTRRAVVNLRLLRVLF